jgi:chromosome segregation ATPase
MSNSSSEKKGLKPTQGFADERPTIIAGLRHDVAATSNKLKTTEDQISCLEQHFTVELKKLGEQFTRSAMRKLVQRVIEDQIEELSDRLDNLEKANEEKTKQSVDSPLTEIKNDVAILRRQIDEQDQTMIQIQDERKLYISRINEIEQNVATQTTQVAELEELRVHVLMLKEGTVENESAIKDQFAEIGVAKVAAEEAEYESKNLKKELNGIKSELKTEETKATKRKKREGAIDKHGTDPAMLEIRESIRCLKSEVNCLKDAIRREEMEKKHEREWEEMRTEIEIIKKAWDEMKHQVNETKNLVTEIVSDLNDLKLARKSRQSIGTSTVNFLWFPI